MCEEGETTPPSEEDKGNSLLLGGFSSLVWGKKRRRELSVAERVKVIHEKDDNPTASQEQLGRMFDISQAQVSRILKHREDILRSWKKIHGSLQLQEAIELRSEDGGENFTPSPTSTTEEPAGNAMDVFEERLTAWYQIRMQGGQDIPNSDIKEKAKELCVDMGMPAEITDYWIIVWKAKTHTKLSMQTERTEEEKSSTRKRQISEISDASNSTCNNLLTGGIVFPGQEDEDMSDKSSCMDQQKLCSTAALGNQRRYIKKNYQLPTSLYLEQEKLIETEVQKNMEMIKARMKQCSDWRIDEKEVKSALANGVHAKVRRKLANQNGGESMASWYQNKDKSIELLIKASLENMDSLYRDQLIHSIGICTTRILGLCGYTGSETFVRIKEEDFARMEDLMQNLLNDMTDQTREWLVGDKPLLKLLILRGGSKNFRFLPAEVTKLRSLAQLMQQKLSPTFILGLQTVPNHMLPTPTQVSAASTGEASDAASQNELQTQVT